MTAGLASFCFVLLLYSNVGIESLEVFMQITNLLISGVRSLEHNLFQTPNNRSDDNGE